MERVREGYRLRSHGEDVADDAADACRGAAVWLDSARMVVRLYPDGVGVILIEGHDSRIAAVYDIRGLYGEDEFLQEDLRGLVAAMLGPCLPQRLQLDICGVPSLRPEIVAYPVHLLDVECEAEVLRHRLQFLVTRTEHIDVVQFEGDVSLEVSVLNIPHPIGVIARS